MSPLRVFCSLPITAGYELAPSLFRAIVNKKQCETGALFKSLVIHCRIADDVQDSQGVSASEMTRIVSVEKLTSTHSLTGDRSPRTLTNLVSGVKKVPRLCGAIGYRRTRLSEHVLRLWVRGRYSRSYSAMQIGLSRYCCFIFLSFFSSSSIKKICRSPVTRRTHAQLQHSKP